MKRFVVICLMACLVVSVRAQEGKSAFDFLDLPVSSHANSLGGNNISIIEEDVSMVRYNPALLGPEMDMIIDLNYMRYMAATNSAGAMFAKAAGARGAWSVGMQYVGYGKVQVVDGILKKEHPEIELDFNAIAQGYSSDMMAHFLSSKGICNYLVDIGGEVIARGCKPNGDHWVVGIEKPAEDKYSTQKVDVKINLDNMSVVTSGNYRKYYESNGVKYSHTINPFTGFPVSHTLLSVSVLSANAWEADAMATAFMVMGLEKSLEFLKNNSGYDAYFIYNDNGEYKTYATEGFKNIIVK